MKKVLRELEMKERRYEQLERNKGVDWVIGYDHPRNMEDRRRIGSEKMDTERSKKGFERERSGESGDVGHLNLHKNRRSSRRRKFRVVNVYGRMRHGSSRTLRSSPGKHSSPSTKNVSVK